MSSKCYICKEHPSTSYKFKKEINNEAKRNTLNKIVEVKNYCHRMCPECLIRYIFIKDITLFSKPSNNFTFICPCKEGKLNLSYEQLIDVFQNKTFDNLQKKKEKVCNTHNKKYSKFCKDCNIDICEDCIAESYEEHFNHRIEDKKILLEKLRKFFEILNLRYYDFKGFMDNFNKICIKFKEILETNYNNTLIIIDKIINDLIDFRAKYSVYYKEKVINSVQTLKILKMFYCNYYYDIKKAEKGDDFKIYKYLNQINFELDDVTLIDNKESMDKLEEIKKNSDYLNDNINKILDINYSFKRVLNGFRKYQSIQRCDDKLLKSIVKIDEHKILTLGESYYMHYLEEKNGDFSKISKIPTKDKIISALLLKNGNILTSFGKNSHFNIQEWIPNDNFSSTKLCNDDLSYNKIVNEPDITSLNSDIYSIGRCTTLDPYRGRNNSFVVSNNFLYDKANSFLSSHKDDINVMIEMSDSMFATGGNDKMIIIWQKDEDSNNYKIFQKITKEIKNLKNGIKHMIYLYDKRFVSSDSNTIYIWKIEIDKLINPDNNYSIEQKLNSSNGNINVIYQIRDGSIITGSNNSHLEIFTEVDGKYKTFQNINLKINSINCVNQLKDDRIIVGSQKGLIKIIGLEGNEYQVNESIITIQGLPINCIECFEDGSFVVGQKSTLHVWRNNESI